jgi:hypothetical protein
VTTVEGGIEVYEPGELRFAPLPAAGVVSLSAALERGAGRAYAAANERHQRARSDLFGLSMSALGTCQRQAAYRVAGAAPDPEYVYAMGEDEARAAMVGTWIHDGLLPEIAALLHGGQHEMRVELVAPVGPTEDGVTPLLRVGGSTDCYTRAAGGGVVDLKSVGAHRLGDIAALGAFEKHRKQVRGYACACIQAGLPVAWTAWLYLDRGDGSVKAVVEPFGQEEYVSTLRWVAHLHALSRNPEYAPRDQRGPGLSWVCDSCPFLRRCWGKDATPGDPAAIAVHDDEGIAFAGSEVVRLRREAAELKKKEDFYRAQVGKPKRGVYGGIEVTYARDGTKPDAKEMARMLTELGYEVPTVPVPGSMTIKAARPVKAATSQKKKEDSDGG